MKCDYCDHEANTLTALRTHVIEQHADEKPYVCERCGQEFKNENSLVRHAKKKHTLDPIVLVRVPERGTKRTIEQVQSPKKATLRAIFKTNHDYVSQTHFATVTNFEGWLTKYREVIENSNNDTQMALSTATAIATDVNLVLRECPTLFDHVAESTFADDLDAYLDSCDNVLPSTIVKRARAVRWYCRYIASQQPISVITLDDLDDTISVMQSCASVHTTSSSLLHILDPLPLTQLSSKIVNLLRAEQGAIEAFICDCYGGNMSLPERVKFGADSLRPFLELSLRFTNVPLRVQCSIGLVDRDEQDYICKLVRIPSMGTYGRLVSSDKVQNYAQPTLIPMDADLSAYMFFYLNYCRVDVNSPIVFQTANGKRWKTASHDIKIYLEARGINCGAIAPNGRFVHGSRHIGLAVFCTLCDYNIDKIRNFAILMRHSLASIEHIYSPWLRAKHAQQAITDVFTLRGQVATVDENLLHKPDLIVTLHRIKEETSRMLTIDASRVLQEHLVIPVSRFTDAACQTDPTVGGLLGNDELGSDQEPPVCGCGTKQSLCGPYGMSKDRTHFARFFTVCRACNPDAIVNGDTLWYPIGAEPVWMPSSSRKPRNIEAIRKHLQRSASIIR
jgi:uncharacterized C2H2 Zn-finger protein